MLTISLPASARLGSIKVAAVCCKASSPDIFLPSALALLAIFLTVLSLRCGVTGFLRGITIVTSVTATILGNIRERLRPSSHDARFPVFFCPFLFRGGVSVGIFRGFVGRRSIS